MAAGQTQQAQYNERMDVRLWGGKRVKARRLRQLSCSHWVVMKMRMGHLCEGVRDFGGVCSRHSHLDNAQTLEQRSLLRDSVLFSKGTCWKDRCNTEDKHLLIEVKIKWMIVYVVGLGNFNASPTQTNSRGRHLQTMLDAAFWQKCR